MSENTDRYKYFYQRGKRLFNEARYKESVEALKNAFKINPSEELQVKINKIEALMKEDEEAVTFKPDEKKLEIEGKYYVNASFYNKLYSYQQEGVIWLFKTFESKKGCILADDMGLGKTIQIIFYLRELFESEMIKTALIIMPKSLLINWEREIQAWAPSVSFSSYIGLQKEKNLKRIQRMGGILITTYGTVTHNWDELNYNPNFKWDVLALDEGHKIKNPSSKAFKTVNALRANTRIVMTGTAVQNNLKELWALFDFTHQGSLLGSYPTFNRIYEKPIVDSRKKDASENEKMYGDQISLSLKKLIRPYFLRRTKEEVSKTLSVLGQNSVPKLTNKNDLVIWVLMTETQIDFYKRFLELDEVKINLLKTEKRSPLLELNILKKICDHPRLLSIEQCAELGLDVSKSISEMEIETLVSESGKMAVLLTLVKKLVEEEHKCLIFSQSKIILNIIQRILISHRIRLLRLDGDVLKVEDRQKIVDNFNTDQTYRILLLTSQVGGVGLTLTGADRVIIYDLNWNPSIDSQSVDRVYRIGQQKNVIIYRLITCGTVEEKIYRRQVFKDSLNRQTTGIKKVDNNSYRYFTQNELFELFTLSDPYKSDTQIQLDEMHSHQRKTDEYLENHMLWLRDQSIFGISDHDLLFSQQDKEIKVDQETKNRLMENMQLAENQLILEAQSKLSSDETKLRMMMANMTINEKHGKVKETVLKEHMFIPNKADLKKPVYNEFMKPKNQLVMDNFISVNKTGAHFENQKPIKNQDHINKVSNLDGGNTRAALLEHSNYYLKNIHKDDNIVEISDDSIDENSSSSQLSVDEGSEKKLEEESDRELVDIDCDVRTVANTLLIGTNNVINVKNETKNLDEESHLSESETDEDLDSSDKVETEDKKSLKDKFRKKIKNYLLSEDSDVNNDVGNKEFVKKKNRIASEITNDESCSDTDSDVNNDGGIKEFFKKKNRMAVESTNDESCSDTELSSHSDSIDNSEKDMNRMTVDKKNMPIEESEKEHISDYEGSTDIIIQENELKSTPDKNKFEHAVSDNSDNGLNESRFKEHFQHLVRNENELIIQKNLLESSLLSDYNESEDILDETRSSVLSD